MYNELDFLTHIPILNNDDNRDSIFNWVRGAVSFDDSGNLVGRSDPGGATVIFKSKDVNNTSSLLNYYKSTTDKYTDSRESDINPYLKLIRDFSEKTGEPNNAFKAMRFKAADFAYLTKLGVYPINRMWVLRRYAEGVTVPSKNLQEWGDGEVPEPTNTMVGWIEPEQDDFFNISFNEKWEKITDRLDQVIGKILKEEFGFNAENVIPLPGFSQGLMFGFLNEMGLTNYDTDTIPQGDPAVLQEAAARATNADPGFGLTSDMKLTLKTSYEQKFIGDIDPGSAMIDIIQNCIYMGTRDVKVVFQGSGEIFAALDAATYGKANSPELWWQFIQSIITAFMRAVNSILDKLKEQSGGKVDEENAKNAQIKKDNEAANEAANDEALQKEWSGQYSSGPAFCTEEDEDAGRGDEGEKMSYASYKEKQKTPTAKPATTTTANTKEPDNTAAGEKQSLEKGEKSIQNLAGFLGNGLFKSILASTVAKWRYALVGSVALMTGRNSTPWHITIGNPYSPFVTLGNVVVTDVAFKFNNELSFNDIPTRLDVDVTIALGRNLGAQEIFRMFNNGYQRVYTPSTESGDSGPKTDNPQKSESEVKNKVTQPAATTTPGTNQVASTTTPVNNTPATTSTPSATSTNTNDATTAGGDQGDDGGDMA